MKRVDKISSLGISQRYDSIEPVIYIIKSKFDFFLTELSGVAPSHFELD